MIMMLVSGRDIGGYSANDTASEWSEGMETVLDFHLHFHIRRIKYWSTVTLFQVRYCSHNSLLWITRTVFFNSILVSYSDVPDHMLKRD